MQIKITRNNFIVFILVVAVIVLATSLILFSKKNEEIAEEGTVGKEIVQANLNIEAPEGIAIEDLNVISLGEVAIKKSDDKFDVKIYKEGVSIVAALLPDKEFTLLEVSLGESSDVNISTESTAQALVFMSPFLFTSDNERAQDIMNIIRSNEEVEQFASVIDRKISSTQNILDDSEYGESFAKAIDSVLAQVYKE